MADTPGGLSVKLPAKLPAVPRVTIAEEPRARKVTIATTSKQGSFTSNAKNQRVNISISGTRFQLLKRTLIKFPAFRLTRILACRVHNNAVVSQAVSKEIDDNELLYDNYDPDTKEYFFERSPEIFPSILAYFATGHLHIPRTVCVELFVEECNYWGVGFAPNDCCQGYYQSQYEIIETFRKANDIFMRRHTCVHGDNDEDDAEEGVEQMEREVRQIAQKTEQRRESRSLQSWRKFKRRAWELFEDPSSSRAASILNIVATLMVLISTISLCLNTHPDIAQWVVEGSKPGDNQTQPDAGCNRTMADGSGPVRIKQDNAYLKVVELICIVWFTFEIFVRSTVCPSKKEFFKSILNWIDVIAILPFYIGKVIEASYGDGETLDTSFTDMRRFLQTLRIFRVIRIFKVARHSAGLQVLGYTVRNSGPELGLLGILLLMGMTLFASLVYYAEEQEPNTKFTSIIQSFWWAIITMTTVGYGDMAPQTSAGQVVGSLCCVSGILFIALPIPTIVTNFSSFYKDHRNKKRLEALYGEDEDHNTDDFNPMDMLLSSDQNLAAPETAGGLEKVEKITTIWKNHKRKSSLPLPGNSAMRRASMVSNASNVRPGVRNSIQPMPSTHQPRLSIPPPGSRMTIPPPGSRMAIPPPGGFPNIAE